MSRQRKRFLERMKKKLFVVFLIAMLGFVALIIRVAYLEIAKGKNSSLLATPAPDRGFCHRSSTRAWRFLMSEARS